MVERKRWSWRGSNPLPSDATDPIPAKSRIRYCAGSNGNLVFVTVNCPYELRKSSSHTFRTQTRSTSTPFSTTHSP